MNLNADPALSILTADGRTISISFDQTQPGVPAAWCFREEETSNERLVRDEGELATKPLLLGACVLMPARAGSPEGGRLAIHALRAQVRAEGQACVLELSIPVPLAAIDQVIDVIARISPQVRADGQQPDILLDSLSVSGTEWVDGASGPFKDLPRVGRASVRLQDAITAVANLKSDQPPIRLMVVRLDDSAKVQRFGRMWAQLGVEGLVDEQANINLNVSLGVCPIGHSLHPGLSKDDLRLCAEVKFTCVGPRGGAIRTGAYRGNNAVNDAMASSRLGLGAPNVVLRAMPALGNLARLSDDARPDVREGAYWNHFSWRYECDFETAGPGTAGVDPLELWNTRLANDLLRTKRTSFLPFFEYSASDLPALKWRLVSIWGFGQKDGQPDDEIYRLILPRTRADAQAKTPPIHATLQSVGVGLPPGAMAKLELTLDSPEPDAKVHLEQALLNPTRPAEATSVFGLEQAVRLRAAASAHGVFLLQAAPGKLVSAEGRFIVVDGVGFELTNDQSDETNWIAWVSLAGRFLATNNAKRDQPDDESLIARWAPQHSHYALMRVHLRVRKLVPLPPSARDNAPVGQLARYARDLDRPVRRGALVVTAVLPSSQSDDHDPSPTSSRLEVEEQTLTRGGIDLQTKWMSVDATRSDSLRVLLIQPQPLMIAMVDGDLGSRDSSGTSSQLGIYDGRAWNFAGTRDFFALLPPACMGETVIRGSKLFDPPEGEEAALAPFRYSPATVLRLRSSADPTNFAPAPWTLPAMLNGGDDNKGGPVGVLAINAELLYGLMMRVTRDNISAASVLRRRGWPVECWKASDLNRLDLSTKLITEGADGWRSVDSTVRSAASAIEFFDPSAQRDEPLVVKDGIAWRLRHNARLADPFATERTSDKFNPEIELGPITGTKPEVFERTELEAKFGTAGLNHKASPLWGGATIGFESRGVLRSFLEKGVRGSSGGALCGLHTGPHGATATFRSEFEDGLIAIECVVEQGVVTRYTVSRKGRIGCLWNKARHVVVYERTAISNPRYTTRTDDRKQAPQNGRAFLRKVDEYVEVLQPRRQYPDTYHSERLCGFVRGSDFGPAESAKYRVEPSWARDVFNDSGNIVGWAVPIWLPKHEQIALGANPDVQSASDARSSLHPMPVISMLIDTERPDGLPDHQLIEDPHKLVFYTRVFLDKEEVVGEPDKWGPAHEIDYCDLISPQTNRSKPAIAQGNDPSVLDGQPDDDESEIEPGFDRFTLTLAPGPRPANIMRGRTREALFGAIRTVQISRSEPRESATANEAGTQVNTVFEVIRGHAKALDVQSPDSPARKLIDSVRAGVGAAEVTIDDAANKWQGELKAIEAELDKVKSAVNVPAAIEKLGALAHANPMVSKDPSKFSPLTQAINSAKTELSGRLSRFQKLIGSDLKDLSEHLIDQALLQSWPAIVPIDRLRALIDRAANRVRSAARSADGALNGVLPKLKALENRVGALFAEVSRPLSASQVNELEKSIDRELEQASAMIAGVFSRAVHDIEDAPVGASDLGVLKEHVIALMRATEKAVTCAFQLGANEIASYCAALRASINAERAATEKALRDLLASVLLPVRLGAHRVIWKLQSVLHLLPENRSAKEWIDAWVKKEIEGLDDARQVIVTAALGRLSAAETVIDSAYSKVVAQADEIFESLKKGASEVTAKLLGSRAAGELAEAVKALEALKGGFDLTKADGDKVDAAFRKWRGTLEAELRDLLKKDLAAASKDFESMKAAIENRLKRSIEAADLQLFDSVIRGPKQELADIQKKLKDKANASLEPAKRVIDDCRKEIDKIKSGAATAADAAKRINQHINAAARDMQSAGRELGQSVTRAARAAQKGDIFALADTGLTLHRAFGHPPRVPGLEFNRKQIAYQFDRAATAIRTTPMAALLDRAGDQIRGLGLRLPTDEFTGTFLPKLREAMDLGKLFPDFAGLKLKDLFRGLSLDNLSSEHVKVRHEFDPKSRTAAVQAEVDYPLPGDSTLVDEGVLGIVLKGATFHAKSRLRIADGVTERFAEGTIKANWVVRFAGNDFVIFNDTELHFDSQGHTRFNLRPEKVKLAGLLGFVSERLRSLLPERDGPVEYLKDALGLPAGVRVTIDMPIPDTQGVTTGFSGLRLGAWFMLALGGAKLQDALAGSGNPLDDFQVGVGFSLAKRERPFTLTAFILGGAGHLDIGLFYKPARRHLRAYVDASMNASASLAFSVAGVSGGVYAYLGIVFRYEAATGSRPSLVFSARLMITGEVDVWGIVSASISIELRLAYVAARKRLVAAGRLRIRIKICWCFTIKISVGFTLPPGVSDEELGLARALASDPEQALAQAIHIRNALYQAAALTV